MRDIRMKAYGAAIAVFALDRFTKWDYRIARLVQRDV